MSRKLLEAISICGSHLVPKKECGLRGVRGCKLDCGLRVGLRRRSVFRSFSFLLSLFLPCLRALLFFSVYRRSLLLLHCRRIRLLILFPLRCPLSLSLCRCGPHVRFRRPASLACVGCSTWAPTLTPATPTAPPPCTWLVDQAPPPQPQPETLTPCYSKSAEGYLTWLRLCRESREPDHGSSTDRQIGGDQPVWVVEPGLWKLAVLHPSRSYEKWYCKAKA